MKNTLNTDKNHFLIKKNDIGNFTSREKRYLRFKKMFLCYTIKIYYGKNFFDL